MSGAAAEAGAALVRCWRSGGQRCRRRCPWQKLSPLACGYAPAGSFLFIFSIQHHCRQGSALVASDAGRPRG
uniref:Uncharacterized protein n=1 Tax=Triticum urartu TaxID=4572 RepID=A0A8R7U1I8_TRIUA